MRLDDLNPPQREAVEHGEGPLLILAGAGSGKTRVITHRLARLVERNVRPWRILAVTFTNKAAGEMRERAAKLLGSDDARRMWIGTFHATCARLLRMHAAAIGLTSDYQIYDDDDQKRLVTQIMKESGLANYVTARQIRSRIDELKNQGITVGEFVPSHYIDDHVATVYAEYQKRLRAANAVDFGDLLLEVLRLTEHEQVGPLLAERFDYVLVDEFQDTNKVQFRLVKRLAWKGNLCVVGDDDQSIYSWRGADVRNILEFDRAFAEEGLVAPPVKVIKLEQNYRSTQTILDAANAVIAKNIYRKSKRLFTEKPGGDPIVYHVSPDERREAADVVRAILTLTEDEGRELGDIAILYRINAQSRALEEALRAARLPYRIFGATRFFDRAEVKDLLGYLRVVANPADEVSLQRIVNTPPRGIGDTTVEKLANFARAQQISLWSAMRAAADGRLPAAGGGRKRPSTTAGGSGSLDDSGTIPLFGPLFGREFDATQKSNDAGAPDYDADALSGPRLAAESGPVDVGLGAGPRKKISAFVQLIEELQGRARGSLADLVEATLTHSGLVEQLQNDESPDARDRLANLEELANSIRDYAREAEERSLSGYLERVALESSTDVNGQGVSLMTVHAAKGLEFAVVFITGLEEGTFPMTAREPGSDEQQLEEERRLAYVAITRARERLILTSAEQRRLFRANADAGDPYERRPSRFINDIPASCLVRTGQRRTDHGPARVEQRRDGTWLERVDHRDDGSRVEREPDAEWEAAPAHRPRRGLSSQSTPAASVGGGERVVVYDEAPDAGGGFRVGQRVRHEMHGEGKVLEVQGSGKALKLKVSFASVGPKTIMASFLQPL